MQHGVTHIVLISSRAARQMSQVGLTETVKGDPKKFEVWLPGRAEVYTILATSVDDRETWVRATWGLRWRVVMILGCRGSCPSSEYSKIRLRSEHVELDPESTGLHREAYKQELKAVLLATEDLDGNSSQSLNVSR